MRYSIEGQELTDIADALRSKHGETELVTRRAPIHIWNDTINYGSGFTNGLVYVVSIPDATTIYVDATYGTLLTSYYKIASGVFTVDNFPQDDSVLLSGYGMSPKTDYLSFENTNAITIYKLKKADDYGYGGHFTVCGTDDNNNFVSFTSANSAKDREVAIPRTFQTNEMAQAIEKLGKPMPEESLALSGSCMYKFYNGGWDWFIKQYGDEITTKELTSAQYMFFGTQLETIPFELNFTTSVGSNLSRMFSGASKLTSLPKMNNCKAEAMDNIFDSCRCLRYVPDDLVTYFDWSYMDNATSNYSGNRSNVFTTCCSLRKVPSNFFDHVNKGAVYSYSYFYQGFNSCYTLDELVELPINYTSTWTSNAFYNTVNNCHRLQNLTFKTPNGQPYKMKWKSQKIDLYSVGYLNASYSVSYITGYNSGISVTKEVINDETYQKLKNDPDWFTCDIAYSRYNHDSAVATINSLPDTSEYLATAGGTNTITFKGNAGSKTDGGAINTLTAEEIAVATAKGWTVSFL